MQMGLSNSLLIAAMMMALAACSGKTKSKDNVAIPKELTDIEASVTFERVWSINLDANKSVRGEHLGPAVAGETLYAAGTGELVAVDLANGKVRWRQKSEELWSAGPATDGKRVVVASLDGKVSCYDANDGEALWSVQVSSEVLAKPLLVDDKVIVRSNDGRVVALEASSGKTGWRFDRDVPLLTLRGSAAPVAENGLVYVPADNGKVAALKIENGALLWEETPNISNGRNELERVADIDGDIALDNGDLFVAGYNGQTSALAAATGSTLWTYQGPSVEGLSFDQRNLYLSDSESKVAALDRRSGAEIWKSDALLNRYLTRPNVVDSYLIVGDFAGFLHALDSGNGNIVGRTRFGKLGFPQAGIVVSDVYYVQSAGGDVAAFRLAD